MGPQFGGVQQSWDLTYTNERVYQKGTVAAGLVFFTTHEPSNDVCASGGIARLYALDFVTGTAPESPIFDITGDGVVDENDIIQIGDEYFIPIGIEIGQGVPHAPIVDIQNEIALIPMSTGEVKVVKIDLPGSSIELKGWREVVQ